MSTLIADIKLKYHQEQYDILSAAIIEQCYAHNGASAIIEAASHIGLTQDQIDMYTATLEVINIKISELADQIGKHMKEIKKLKQ